MSFLLHANLKADMWAKHKSFLTGSTGVGDKLKTLESFAKCREDDSDGLQNLNGAIAALMQVAVPAFQKAKSSKIIPSSTSKYLQEMIAKATELRSLVAQKQEKLTESAANEKDTTKGPNNDWLKSAANRIKSYFSEVEVINKEVELKKLSGTEIGQFKEWAKNSQNDLKKINDVILSKNITSENVKIAETRINKYLTELKNYDQEITKLSNLASALENKDIKNDSTNNKDLTEFNTLFAKYQQDIIKNKNEFATLRNNVISKKGDRKSLDLMTRDILNYKNDVQKIEDELKSRKISSELSKDIRTKILNYQTEIKNYETEFKKLTNITNSENNDIKNIKTTTNDDKEAIDLNKLIAQYQEDILKNKNEFATLRNNFISKKGDRKSLDLMTKDILNYKNDVKSIEDELKSHKISPEISKGIISKITTYNSDIKNYETEINKIKTEFLKETKPKP